MVDATSRPRAKRHPYWNVYRSRDGAPVAGLNCAPMVAQKREDPRIIQGSAALSPQGADLFLLYELYGYNTEVITCWKKPLLYISLYNTLQLDSIYVSVGPVCFQLCPAVGAPIYRHPDYNTHAAAVIYSYTFSTDVYSRPHCYRVHSILHALVLLPAPTVDI